MNMKSVRILLLLLITSAPVYAQESYVQRNYVKEIDTTLVNSVSLYVINQLSQFMSLEFKARYHGQASAGQLPDVITIEFSSYGVEPIYQSDLNHRLSIKADDEVIDRGLMGYSQIQRIGKGKMPRTENERVIEALRPRPPSAALVVPNQETGLVLELMSVAIAFEDLEKISKAHRVLIKTGKTVVALTPTHLSILQAFVKDVRPGEMKGAPPVAAVEESTVAPDVPSEANKTPLDVTLKWIAAEMRHTKPINAFGTWRKIDPLDFKSCHIQYNVVPTQKTHFGGVLIYPTVKWEMNLADLNSETVGISDSKEFSEISVRTRDLQPKIKMKKLREDKSPVGKIVSETKETGATILLPDKQTAERFKVAFVHAISLCEGQP